MKPSRWLLIVSIIAVISGFVACQRTATRSIANTSPLAPVSPLETEEPALTVTPEVLVPPTPILGEAAITGVILNDQSHPKPVADTVVWLGRIFWDDARENAAFAIDASSGPSTTTDANGKFLLTGIEPGDYVIVVGDLDGSHVVIAEPDDPNTAMVYTIDSETILDVGELHVALPE